MYVILIRLMKCPHKWLSYLLSNYDSSHTDRLENV
jgi:hypothetical protein